MTAIRRLIVCLDGTWNNRDDSTNVLHHFALTSECRERKVHGDSVTQLKLYLEGVGTGPLDAITGGGFGFGLETNVRAAYNWLVQNYEDETAFTPADEIYIFGFSRGAFTARSLVGFVSTCGLLRRGAPLTVNELWRTYCLIGRAREHHSGPLTDLFPDPPLAFRRITDLVWDPWLIRKKEAAAPRPAGHLPGQRAATLNPTEELLVRWSRRVKITYLGVYDTVGAVGWDALAIPGIRSRLALHHNMRPTTLIQRCRHALAIDEHRSSFGHTPFVAYISADTAEGELRRIESEPVAQRPLHSDPMASLSSAWTKRIEQRWFVGAHANVGGGYASNPLAQQPLTWLLEGARDAGLICDHLPKNVTPDRRLGPRDSFMEFAKPYWSSMLRAKRSYRVLDPDPEIRAERRHRKEPCAFMLVNINEQVDPGAVKYLGEPDRRRSSPESRRVREAEEGPRQGPGRARRANAEAPVDGKRFLPLPRARAMGHICRGRNPGSRYRFPYLDSGVATGMVAGDCRGGVRVDRLGGELPELHDGDARRRARSTGLPRFHLLDAHAVRRPVRVRRPGRDRARWASGHERGLTRRRLAEVSGADHLFRNRGARRGTRRRAGRGAQPPLRTPRHPGQRSSF